MNHSTKSSFNLPQLVENVLSDTGTLIDNLFADAWRSLNLSSLSHRANIHKRSGGILTIHGVGSQKKAFAAPFQNLVKSKLDKDANQFIWQDIFWADLLLERENRLWKSMQSAQQANKKPFPLDYSRTRQFLVHNVGDALAYYRSNGNAYILIHDKVAENSSESS